MKFQVLQLLLIQLSGLANVQALKVFYHPGGTGMLQKLRYFISSKSRIVATEFE